MSETWLSPVCSIEIHEDEYWWGGLVANGVLMPLSAKSRCAENLSVDLKGNQGAPFLVSSQGRYLWSSRAFRYEFAEGRITLSGSLEPVLLSEEQHDLPSAFRAAAVKHFPAGGTIPPVEFFTRPQYNTWIELNHHQTQQGVLDYARGIVENGFPVGVLMIDAGWAEYFGSFEFHSGRFPNPKQMMEQLKAWGFRVMLWVSPFISADSGVFRQLRYRPNWLLQEVDGSPAILPWWDGYSAHLDLSCPEAVAWFHAGLQQLQREYGIDGFKFDAGDTIHFKSRPHSVLNATPTELTELWAKIALQYPYNELRTSWKCGGQALIQRLADKSPLWDQSGLGSLIPNGIAEGLVGHPFVCPDMIGGGDYVYFTKPNFVVDEELFIRSAQTSALFPMMQFSSAPWRVLSEKGCDLCRKAAQLHVAFEAVWLESIAESSKTGEPILRPLEYNFPKQGYEKVVDQFMIGQRLLVAPALQAGASTRSVVIPPGEWKDDCGKRVIGPQVVRVKTPLDRLPYYTLL